MKQELPKNWREIATRVNAEVNALPYKADVPGADEWGDIDAAGGDCDNYAIGKLNRLVAEGFPIERLRLATCFVGRQAINYGSGKAAGAAPEAHVVLVVDAKDDHYALDNLQAEVVPVLALIGMGYALDCIQKEGGSREWVEWRHS